MCVLLSGEKQRKEVCVVLVCLTLKARCNVYFILVK
jgi:hypothetical protein